MSSADLWEDDYPHGTPEGYDEGCKGGACPAGVAYGLSCKIARQKSRGDFQYQKLAKAGASVPEIAEALGLIGTEPPAAPVSKARAPKPTPKTVRQFGVSIAEAAAALQKANDVTAVRAEDVGIAVELKPPLPFVVVEGAEETSAAFDETAAAVKELTAAGVDEQDVDAAAEAVAELTTSPAVAPRTPAAPPKPSEIRAWARDKGYAVGEAGRIPQRIVDHFWEATGRLDPDATPLEQDATELEVDALAPEVDTAAADPDAEQLQVDSPAVDVDEPEISDVMVEIEMKVPEDTRPPRPDWGTVAAHVDVEEARRWAVRFEQEYAHIEEKLAATETEFASLTAQAERLLADVEREQAEAMRIAGDYVDEFGKNLKHQEHIEDLRERLADQQQLRRVAERAATLTLKKWGEERAANESAHALILQQAQTINTLCQLLAPLRWEIGAGAALIDPDTARARAGIGAIWSGPGDTHIHGFPRAQAPADPEPDEDVTLGFDGSTDGDTIVATTGRRPRLWHRR